MPEKFDFDHSIIDETVAVDEEAGGAKAKGNVRLQLAKLKLHGELDPENLSASGSAEATTGRVDAQGEASVGNGAVGVHGDGYAQGPAAGIEGEVGPDGVGGKVGASAGTAGAHGGVEILGEKFGAGVDVGLKAELGVKWGSTSRIDLPLISLEGPNPAAAATEWAVDAAGNLIKDPVGTVERAAEDIINVPGDVVGAVTDLFDDDEPDDKAVTTDQHGGPQAPLKPGQSRFD